MPNYRYKRITATGVTVISPNESAILHAIAINQQSTAAVSTSLATVYANSTNAGNIIGIIQLNASGVADYLYDIVSDGPGLTLNISAGANPVDVTVAYT